MRALTILSAVRDIEPPADLDSHFHLPLSLDAVLAGAPFVQTVYIAENMDKVVGILGGSESLVFLI